MTEIEKLKSEIEDNKNYLSAQKIIMENKIKNGWGKQIIDELEHPPLPNKKNGVKLKWARAWKIFKENLKKIL